MEGKLCGFKRLTQFPEGSLLSVCGSRCELSALAAVSLLWPSGTVIPVRSFLL